MIPRESFIYPTGAEQITGESGRGEGYILDIKNGVKDGYIQSFPSVDGQSSVYILKPNNGLYTPIVGATFPLKTFPEANAVFACNLVKAMAIEPVRVLSKWYFLPFLLIVDKKQLVESWNRIAFKAMSAQLLHDHSLTRFSVAFKSFIYNFMVFCGFPVDSSKIFSLVFTHIIEYDNAYRLRIADIFSETTHDKLKNPKEIIRLLNIARLRETRPGGKGEAIHKKFRMFGLMVYFLLLIPKYRKAYKKAIDTLDLQSVQLDDNDIFYSGLRSDYLFQGKSQEQRVGEGKQKGWVYPNLTTVQ